jgi:sugar transferase (PEP-CTERM/EpsH1 system associated)
MVDVDSEKWRSYAERKPWPMSALYRREADRLLAFERRLAGEFDSTVFVSREEADLFRSLAPECAAKTTYRIQGVDSEFFDPAGNYPNPFPAGAAALVFTGAMDYWPNVDAVGWFAEQAWPRIRRQVPNARFFIVGMRPAPEVSRLAQQPGITVTGAVADVRPYLAHAHAAILPLRIARGIQNKVLEAMAMRLPVIGTPEAMTGIAPFAGFAPIISERADTLADAAVRLLQEARHADNAARACVLERYNWDANLQRIARLLETGEVEPDL